MLRSGWEVVIGSRRCAGAAYTVPQGRLRRLGSFAFRTMASDLSGPITDTQCGFKLFHSKVAKELFAATTLTGFTFDVEVLALARQRNLRMIELPIQWSDSPESSFRPLVDGAEVVPRVAGGPPIAGGTERPGRVAMRSRGGTGGRLMVITNWRDSSTPRPVGPSWSASDWPGAFVGTRARRGHPHLGGGR